MGATVSVLSDRQIRNYNIMEMQGQKLVDPLREDRIQPASVDLLLGYQFRVIEAANTKFVDLNDRSTYRDLTKAINVTDEFVLHPQEFVLATTQETVSLPSNMMARVEGKSSLGRLGLIVHATAGFIDPGFSGQITLEMTNLLRVPIVLHPGQAICQISFSFMSQPVERPYDGKYQGQRGVTESRFTG
jgi:dCTP deaminase